MIKIELNDMLFAKLAGWQVVKQARAIVAAGRVLDSTWESPFLTGMVQEGTVCYRAGLKVKSQSDAENLCTCRDSRQRGMVCAHSIALGIHFIGSKTTASTPAVFDFKAPAKPPVKSLLRTQPGENGEAAEIFVILPPNLAQAAAKGRIMLCVEAKWRKGRAPLETLPMDVPFVFTEQDAALLDALQTLAETPAPSILMLEPKQFSGMLPKLIGHPGVTLGRAETVEIAEEPVRLSIRATLDAQGEILLNLAGAAPDGLIRGETSWIFQHKKLQPLGLPPGFNGIYDGQLRIPRSRVPQFLNLEWPALNVACDVKANFELADFVLETAMPSFKLHIAGGLTMLEATLVCCYGTMRVTPGVAEENDAFWIADPSAPTRYSMRNFDAERAALARLLRNGFSGPDAKNLFTLKGQNAVLNFFAREYPRIEKDWTVTLEERLELTTQRNMERIEPRFQITASGEQWFDLNVAYATGGGGHMAAVDVQRLLLSGQSHTRLGNGKFALLDTGAVEELQEVLLDCAPRQHGQGYRLNNVQAGFLDATLRSQQGWQVQAPQAWTQRAAQQRGEVKLAPQSFGELNSVLRPYQKEGVAWLQFLRENGFGGILADEMGLGKTLQVLAHLQSQRTNSGNAPALVICPTSLVFNWVAEIAKFTPGLRVLALHGPQRRELFACIPQHDVVVTSYAVLRRDAEHYRDIEFDTVVLDEAQHIKNRQTQNAQAVKSIRALHRIVLTGTPMENSVLDLWSIFDFLMPGYLGAAEDFRERYEQPIIRDRNSVAQARLARRLRPFMLRRLKRDVAADLPEKIEQVSYCDLNEEQRSVYQQVLEASRREITDAVKANGLAKSRMVVLTALLRLRQICCDLRLLGSKLGQEPADIAGKVGLFEELLEEVIDGGHRALVFSQFTTMLGLLRDRLVEEKIDFCYLDGSTKDRAQIVQKFQNDARIPVFLISLKAGGTGLNLTGADTVIHFDPWWNPAVESQATDRAHRIGQQKVVTSYKLITRGTVEEKILTLQNRKRGLIHDLLGGEEQLSESLTWDEINDLLAG
jgi:superfamily II DNA or RNA helicase